MSIAHLCTVHQCQCASMLLSCSCSHSPSSTRNNSGEEAVLRAMHGILHWIPALHRPGKTWSNMLLFLLYDLTFDFRRRCAFLNLLPRRYLCPHILSTAKPTAGTQPEPHSCNTSNKGGNKPIYPQEFSQEFMNSVSP